MSKSAKRSQPSKLIRVLDKGYVELQEVWGSDLAIVNAARTSLLGESKGEKADKKLLFYLMKHRHTSPFEQAGMKFRVRAPLMVFWQWVRHRTFKYTHVNSQSGRYAEFSENDFYIPERWRLQDGKNKQGSRGNVDGLVATALSESLMSMTQSSYELYKAAISHGVAREQARLFLPAFGLYYTWVVSADIWNLTHFLSLRLADDAQWEIRQYAKALYNVFEQEFPWTAEAYQNFMS